MAKRSDEASDSGKAPEPAVEPVAAVEAAPVVEASDYDGKQHYPKALYGKYPDGTVVAEKVEDRAHHARLLAESPELGWAESPADHGLETAPAGAAAGAVAESSVKHAGIVGKV